MSRITIVCLWGVMALAAMALAPGAVPAAPAGTTPAEVMVEVIGTSRVQGEDMDASRTLAISNGLVNAIDRAMADLMPLPVRVEKFKSLNGTFYNEPDRFVLGYKVLAETASGKTYRVLVQATISMTTLKKYLTDAKFLPEETASQRILLLISEQNVEEQEPRYWWAKGLSAFQGASEIRMAEVLQQQGFKIVPHDQIPPRSGEEKPGSPVLPAGPAPSDTEALAIGKRFQADVVIIAAAATQNVGNVMGETQKSFKATFSGRMLRTDSGEKISEIFRSAVAVGTDPQSVGRQALTDVGGSVAESWAPQIKTGMQKKADAVLPITIIVEGTRNLSAFVNFRSMLKEMPMVSELETTGIKPNEATLSARVKGTPQTLADAIMLKPNEGFGINISQITPDTIQLVLVPKNP